MATKKEKPTDPQSAALLVAIGTVTRLTDQVASAAEALKQAERALSDARSALERACHDRDRLMPSATIVKTGIRSNNRTEEAVVITRRTSAAIFTRPVGALPNAYSERQWRIDARTGRWFPYPAIKSYTYNTTTLELPKDTKP